ncbi:hypothetical protein BDP27DRAFT_1433385 [Rhodocollybia butyracea]|uniref:NB-ARC domain-containing protein n=1 Tax=Rhodocollybia butyracea TaxID=206335 RepID=A0A9P5P7K0_9AGAR|nr:hypothetical protein BDP27DRAFT_1433385 [Rhodocollybia butyracea]
MDLESSIPESREDHEQGSEDHSVSTVPQLAMFRDASHFSIQGSTLVMVGRDYNVTNNYNNYNMTSPMRPNLSIDHVLRCPPPSNNFVGRKNILQKLSKIFAAPVVSITCEKADMMDDIVSRVKTWSEFSFIVWDASSEDGLEMGVAEWNSRIEGTSNDTLLILQNADPSIDFESRIPYSLHTHVLILSTNSEVSLFASSAGSIFKLSASMNKRMYRELFEDVRKAFAYRQHIVSLVARGGTGKTQVARKFVYDHGKRFSHHWAFDASSETRLISHFKTLGDAANVGNEVEDVLHFLANIEKEWLLIFDNADHGVDLAKYIPRCNHGNVLITTRDKEVHQLSSLDHPFPDIPDLIVDEAIELLLKSAHQEDSEETHLAIVHALGCQALAIATAGTYVWQHPTCQLKDYLKVFNQKHDALLNFKLNTMDRYDSTIFIAFQLSFDFLSGTTKSFMKMCSLFHHFAIPIEIFYRGMSFTLEDVEIPPGEEGVVKSTAKKLTSFLTKFSDELDVNDSVDELAKMSLASYSADDHSISFHPVVHHCAQEIVDEDNLDYVGMLLLADVTPGVAESIEDYQFQRQLLAHVDHLYDETTGFPSVLIAQKLAWVFFQEGIWHTAAKLQEHVVEVAKRSFGRENVATFATMSNLAVTYGYLGRYNEAEVLQKEVLPLYKTVLGEQHPRTLTVMSNFACTYASLGRYKEAEILGKEALQLRRAVHGEKHSSTLESMVNLATIDSFMGRYHTAEVLSKDLLQLSKTLHGERHPKTLFCMSQLAMTYHHLGRYNEAEVLQQEVLNLHKIVIGEHHPDTLGLMLNLACTYSKLGRYKQANVLGEEVLQLHKTVLGEEHPNTLASMAYLASTYSDMGRYKEAEILEKEILQLHKIALGEKHPATLAVMSNLVLVHLLMGKYNEAEALGKEVLQLRSTVLGEQHPSTLTSMSNLAYTYSELGKYHEAETSEKEVLQLRRTVLR